MNATEGTRGWRWILAVIALMMALTTVGCTSPSAESEETTATDVPPAQSQTDLSTTTTSSAPDQTRVENTTTSSTTTTPLAGTSTTTTPPATAPGSETTTTSISGTTTSATTAASDNARLHIAISEPTNLSSHIASFDSSTKTFRSLVTFVATASDPDGDSLTIEWYSSIDGYLGTGTTITAALQTIYDTAQPHITARATDPSGAVAEDRIQVIVWIPSDA